MMTKRILDAAGNFLEAIDEKLGYTVTDRILRAHHEEVPGVPEQGHMEVVAEYPSGGKDEAWVVDVPGVEPVPAWDEYEDILRYVPYTAEQLAELAKPTLEARLDALEGVLERLREAMGGNALLRALVDKIWPGGETT